jgi:hypothetical protein
MPLKMCIVLALASLACSGVVVPSTSLNTLPVVYIGGTSAARPKENIAMLAKMRYVIIEKWEGHCWNDCVKNASEGVKCEASCHEEAAQSATLKAVKALNPNVAGIFYQNTMLDFNFLELHQRYVDADALLHNVDGTLCQLESDNGMKNITVFDYSKEIGQQLWLNQIKNLTQPGVVDGFYGDTMQVSATENSKGEWTVCKSRHSTCCTMNSSTAAAYNAGKDKTMKAAYAFLGEKAVFFKISDIMHGCLWLRTASLKPSSRPSTRSCASHRTYRSTALATKRGITIRVISRRAARQIPWLCLCLQSSRERSSRKSAPLASAMLTRRDPVMRGIFTLEACRVSVIMLIHPFKFPSSFQILIHPFTFPFIPSSCPHNKRDAALALTID